MWKDADNPNTSIPEVLTKAELGAIYRLWAIEKEWWSRWDTLLDENRSQDHWSLRGEDGWYKQTNSIFGTETTSNVRCIDMRHVTFLNPLTQHQDSVGWVPAERILPWQPGVVPTAINWFTRRFFNRELFGYQLYFYYLCQPNMLLVGGRGSAKTTGLATVAGAWVSLHPGQGWAHFAYTGAQAMEVYAELDALGTTRYPQGGQNYEDAPLSWEEVFVRERRMSPYGYIRIRPWQSGDPGTELLIRPLGQSQKATTTRSIDVRRTSIDECTYDIADENILAVAEASARGTNSVVQGWLPAEQQAEINAAKIALANLDERDRTVGISDTERETMNEIVRRFRSYGISCRLSSIRTGNRGSFPWIDETLERGRLEPSRQWAATVSFMVNPHLDRVAREKLISTYADPMVARVELYAERPIGRGIWFTQGVVLGCESKSLTDNQMYHVRNGTPGHIFDRWGPYLVDWRRPYDSSKFYVIGCDPGTSMIPTRDSWTVMAWEVDLNVPVANLAYWRWGNTSHANKGSWRPFLNALQEGIDLYRVPHHCVIVQVGGQEAGIAETAFGVGSSVSTVHMTEQTKGQMANYARQLMSHGFVKWPIEAADLSSQLTSWEFQDRKLDQDLVMSLFASSWILFQYFYSFIPTQAAEIKDHESHVFRKKNAFGHRARRLPLTPR